jgi:hypothetical protein
MSLLDPKWKYTHSTATDIRRTFAKARRELPKEQKSAPQPAPRNGKVFDTARLFGLTRLARARGLR